MLVTSCGHVTLCRHAGFSVLVCEKNQHRAPNAASKSFSAWRKQLTRLPGCYLAPEDTWRDLKKICIHSSQLYLPRSLEISRQASRAFPRLVRAAPRPTRPSWLWLTLGSWAQWPSPFHHKSKNGYIYIYIYSWDCINHGHLGYDILMYKTCWSLVSEVFFCASPGIKLSDSLQRRLVLRA